LLIPSKGLLTFIEDCWTKGGSPFGTVYAPVWPADKDSPHALLTLLRGKERLALDGHRATDPVKLLFYGVRERVAPLGDDDAPALLAGVKACDLKALELLDKALIDGDFVDPSYRAWRERTTVLSFDCTDLAPTCHCTLVGGKPFAETGFDANAAKFGDHHFLTAATDKGRALLALIQKTVRVDAHQDTLPAAVEARRAGLTARVQEQSAEFSRSDAYARLRAAGAEDWSEASADCVGCGACTHICPTCYCLILNDEGRGGDFVKVRSYDSCQWHGYARVAAGVSPRPRISERFRHRYLCKLVNMMTEFGTLGCTGCGRCTEACPGGIDFRKVVHDLTTKPDGVRPNAEVR
jgi:sulfhydrogenase subunit beta (sulfur reductase)